MAPKWKRSAVEKLTKLYPGKMTAKQIAKSLKRSVRSIEGMASRLGLKKLKNPSRYVKGQSGRQPRPIGSERLDSCGYVMVKLSNGVWKHKQRLAWKEYYNVEPNGNVAFKNGDRSDCSKENLYLISPKEQLAKNTVAHLPEGIKELVYMKGTLTRMINHRRRKENEQHAETKGQPVLGDGGTSSRQD